MWFTYLMIFLEKVLRMHSFRAGLLMLIGQVTDAISTPLVGLLSDASHLPSFMQRFGRRKAWHMIGKSLVCINRLAATSGTSCVTLSFPFIFGKCRLCPESGSEWLDVAYFTPFIMAFQFGWASVQVSHSSSVCIALDLAFSLNTGAVACGEQQDVDEFLE
ncbi:Protein F16H11.1, partial [Aphelenchoides avenae]